jgi:hypothetical protein
MLADLLAQRIQLLNDFMGDVDHDAKDFLNSLAGSNFYSKHRKGFDANRAVTMRGFWGVGIERNRRWQRTLIRGFTGRRIASGLRRH